MNNSILVSIIIPVYNSIDSLVRLLDSFSSASDNIFEIIIIDDGSTDGSFDFIANYNNVKLIRQQNSGVSCARNNGINIASGKYIMFADADDTFNLDVFKKIESELENIDYNLIVYGYSTVSNDIFSNVSLSKDKITINNEEFFFENLNNGVYWMAVWNKIYKTEIAKNILFDNLLYNGEDFDFNIRYLKAIDFQNIKIIDEILYNYYICPGNYKYRNNSIKTRFEIFSKLLKLDKENKYTEYINYYFWNAVFYDFVALYKTNKLDIKEKKKELFEFEDFLLIKKISIPKSISFKKKVLISIIKINQYFGLNLIGFLKRK